MLVDPVRLGELHRRHARKPAHRSRDVLPRWQPHQLQFTAGPADGLDLLRAEVATHRLLGGGVGAGPELHEHLARYVLAAGLQALEHEVGLAPGKGDA
jgi:hypothetical protein